MLGYPSFASRSLGYKDVNQVGSTFWSFYVQDDFKVSSNLSINLGLRYEFRGNPIDKANNIVSFFPLGAPFSGPGTLLCSPPYPTRRTTRCAAIRITPILFLRPGNA